MKRNRVARIVLIALVPVLTAALVGVWMMFGPQLKAAQSVQKLDEGLWSMEYTGDYGFDEFLAQGGASSDEEMAVYISSFLSHGFWKPDTATVGGKFGCSTLSAQSPEGHSLFGRNFDWENCDSTDGQYRKGFVE
nr:hypothetical protein [uncultured Oscillibacter sp.]